MPYIDTSTLDEFVFKDRMNSADRYQIYNGLDCCVTAEIFEHLSSELRKQNEPFASDLYNFEKGMQGLALDMMRRGFLTDPYERRLSVEKYEKDRSRIQSILNKYASAVWGMPLNPNSPKQLRAFFYQAMGLPEQFAIYQKRKVVSCNRECLENLMAYFYPIPIINCIFGVRDATKKLSVLTTGISPSGRFHSTFSPASTETGRWSSSKDAFGEGGNAQNITAELRKVFIADKGKKLIHFDQKQAESVVVGLMLWALGDPRYLEAFRTGDLHTTVAKLIWPGIVHDKKSAEQIFYRHFTYRDMAKRGGHLSNYKGKPRRMADVLRLPLELCENFQYVYYKAFGLEKFHQYIAQEIQLKQSLITPLGMQRHFFGNPYDEEVLKEAIAFIPQSTVAQVTSLIAYRAWINEPRLEPLTHDHDGFTWQFSDDRQLERTLADYIQSISKIPLRFLDKEVIIPLEISVGWNWALSKHPLFDKNKNPDGLVEYKGEDTRVRSTWKERLVE
jgi:hypothetical protein